jgi:hypothetical protein
MKQMLILGSFLIVGAMVWSWRATAVNAQTAATEIETMTIDLWPDYDQESVLVLLTGTLPPTVALPAVVTIPLPADADLHVVARISQENNMVDDIAYEVGENGVTFTTPDARFRVEYYMPYTVEGSQRTFTYTWLASESVIQLELAVQEPLAATNMVTDPEAATVMVDSRDGLTYHILPVQPVPAAIPYVTTITYTMSEPTLTVNQAAPIVAAPATVPATIETAVSPTNWPLILGILGGGLILLALVWQLATKQAQKKITPSPYSKSARPQTASPKVSATKARFCHQCGEPLVEGDNFCRKCGTAVKKL